MVNYEIKSQLAKLLATEDLVVENRNVNTACFDVENRVLTLPMWEKASGTVYDMLVGHEVGHALFTPDDWSWEKRVPQQFVNVTEDARIEKLMKRKYPGLTKTFYKAYKNLSEDDFFELSGVDINTMNLADRINLKYKIGNWIDIPFTDEEMELVELVGKSETFNEAVFAAEEIYRYSKEQLNTQTPQPQDDVDNPQAGDGDLETEDQQETSEETPDTPEMTSDKEGEGQSLEQNDEDESEQIEPEVTTDSTFSENISELNRDIPSGGNSYYEVPKLNYDRFTVPNSEIHELIDEYWKVFNSDSNVFEEADNDYSKFKKSAQKEVNYLVKEFECKKSADAYARTTTARTGVLDCTKLHTYKYNEDLFRKVNVIPDGKNHGLVFILDWSGSMCDSLLDTIKQLYNLVWFCSKVNIPFEVYAFTNSYNRRHEVGQYQNEPEKGKFIISGDFNLMNLLTSKVNKKTLDNQLINIWRVARQFRTYSQYNCPIQVSLSGTPLNESLVALHTILPKFKRENQLQKVQCVILTDGESGQLNHFDYYTDYKGVERMGGRQCRGERGYLRNRKTGHTYQIGYQYWNFTDVLLEDLKRTFPDTNFVGIRLVAPRDLTHFIKRYGFISEQDLKKARKEKSYTIQGSGYDAYFAMIQNSLSSDTEFEVEDEASKSKIKSAFMKSLKAKSLNKKVLSQFMDLVC